MLNMKCICCKKDLTNIIADELEIIGNQPCGANVFYTVGHFASDVFDSTDGSLLEINVCDVCLRQAAQDGIVLVSGGLKYRCSTFRRWQP